MPKGVSTRKLTEVPFEFWSDSQEDGAGGTEVELEAASKRTVRDGEDGVEGLSISDQSTCVKCALSFENYVEQRAHFGTDWHRYNLRQVSRGRPCVGADEFDAMEIHDTASLGSLSASEDSSSEDEGTAGTVSKSSASPSSIKVEFADPADKEKFMMLYKAALPDQQSLRSLRNRGSWAVIMSGGGHFAACVWDAAGNQVRHKTFHRYTSRKKQGGSQAAADSQGGKRIRSAGATLRRHGEQQLQNEVRSLLTSWADALADVQCVYIRANMREKRDLLTGWPGSPLHPLTKTEQVRSIPFPTRRATLKEATRCYDELQTVWSCATSMALAASASKKQTAANKASSGKPGATKPTGPSPPKAPAAPKEKGTAHLKKRVEKPAAERAAPQHEAPPSEEPLDESLVSLLRAVAAGDTHAVAAGIAQHGKDALFPPRYVAEVDTLSSVDPTYTLGLVGAASAAGLPDMVTHLLDLHTPPGLGHPAYILGSKPVRTALRKHWAAHASAPPVDYGAAGVPGPLTADDEARAQEKRRREREKKKRRADAKREGAKTPEQRAREARAAAAERRLRGVASCDACGKPLPPAPFERLAYRYCSTTCVAAHRERLAADAQRERARGGL